MCETAKTHSYAIIKKKGLEDKKTKSIKIISTILCIVLVSMMFSSVAFAGNSGNCNYVFNLVSVFGEGKISNVIRSAESVYDVYDVPEPPLWHTILFLPFSIFLVVMLYI